MIYICLIVGAVMLLFCKNVLACTTVAIGRDVSQSGKTIVGHNEDDRGIIFRQYHYMPRRMHDEGAAVSAEYGAAVIGQVKETAGFIWGESRQENGASYTDFFLNDRGVLVTSDNCKKSKEESPVLYDGGIGYALRRIVAERADSAKQGVLLAMELVSRYGYRGGARSYQIADKNNIWMLHLLGGIHYAAVRVPDYSVSVIANHYNIRNIFMGENTDDVLYSQGLREYAVEKGWCEKTQVFDFYKIFQHADDMPNPRSAIRQRHGLRLLLGKNYAESDLPFSVKAENMFSRDDVKKVLRTHYEGTDDDLSREEQTSVHETSKRTICTKSTLDSFIVEFSENIDDTVLWLAQGKPCQVKYIPVRLGDRKVGADMHWQDAAEAMDTHFQYNEREIDKIKHTTWYKNNY